ncbi:methyl-accepting chemotaxis protein [Vannielia litorea]|uniref:methyl-accepting chemotaxis protein n=1 Tax=Vannielia litorea TaxID=1217970 RepID=UPI001BCB37E3|nr:PAS domain S-box protein [Vannielia litorea]MBS8228807.1 PAS domain S-box protein [Vannielia litorea]
MGLVGFGRTRVQVRDPMALLGEAVQSTYAVIWFAPDGTVLDANANFCGALGYAREEIVGQHHRMFVQRGYGASEDYKDFWQRLARGESFSAVFPRIAKGDRNIWIEAAYVPIRNAAGDVEQVVKFATDVTERETAAIGARRKLEALDKSQAVIEFEPDGTIVSANANFLAAVGYELHEIKGKHHSMFVREDLRKAPEYQAFWSDLAKGEPKLGKFRRWGKGGREMWLEATYNPIIDSRGKVERVVKVAADITETRMQAIDSQGQLEALGRSQAVIEFSPEGIVQRANENFLKALGYTEEEIVGQHHSIFVDPEVVKSPDYATFWEELAGGVFQSAQFMRLAKDGREVWIQASYNPILDADGKVAKVVKFATEITAQKRAITELQEAVSRLASHDLGVCIDADVPEEFLQLKEEFNLSIRALSEVISGISGRADAILTETGQISVAARDLSMRTEKQAAALEETAAALDEMTSSVRGAAMNADDAAKTASAAEESTASGLEMSRKAVEAMKEIAASSEQVSNITSVIDEIAFQTNLLALNAGVEAARAGESGRGFAVVASEVRQLALRSSDSSREIAQLVASTFERIQAGVKLVDESGTALEQIAGYVQDIRGRVASLATSAQEQSVGLDEINSAVNDLDRGTQQNAAMFEETSAATQALEREAETLSGSTRQFRFGGAGPEADASRNSAAQSGQAATG